MEEGEEEEDIRIIGQQGCMSREENKVAFLQLNLKYELPPV